MAPSDVSLIRRLRRRRSDAYSKNFIRIYEPPNWFIWRVHGTYSSLFLINDISLTLFVDILNTRNSFSKNIGLHSTVLQQADELVVEEFFSLKKSNRHGNENDSLSQV